MVVFKGIVLEEFLTMVGMKNPKGLPWQLINSLDQAGQMVIHKCNLSIVSACNPLFLLLAQLAFFAQTKDFPTIEFGFEILLVTRICEPVFEGLGCIVENMWVHQMKKNKGIFMGPLIEPFQGPVDLDITICHVVV